MFDARNVTDAQHGQSKAARYNNLAQQDGPGRMAMIEKGLLDVDRSYQREHDQAKSLNKIKEFTRDWSWISCGAIIVAQREGGGRYFVVDGQHRVLAAMRRADIEKLPCIIFQTRDAVQEAKGFLAIHSRRKVLTAYDKFRALIMTDDRAALVANELIASAGRVAGNYTSANSVSCLTLLMAHANKRETELRRVWPLVVAICAGHPLHERIIDGLMYVETHMPEGESVCDKRWKERFLSVGYEKLQDSCIRAASFYKKGGAKAWAIGMAEAVNYKCRVLLHLRNIGAAEDAE